jgi:hypothetical protein
LRSKKKVEVLMNKIMPAALLGFLGWIGIEVTQLKTDTAVVAQKVTENHRMLSVLWDDFIQEKRNGHLAWFNGKTSE